MGYIDVLDVVLVSEVVLGRNGTRFENHPVARTLRNSSDRLDQYDLTVSRFRKDEGNNDLRGVSRGEKVDRKRMQLANPSLLR